MSEQAETIANQVLQHAPTQAGAGAPALEQKKVPGPEGAIPPKEPEKKEDRASGKLQTLVRREKIALQKEQAAKIKEAEVERKTQELQAREARLREFETIKETNPKKALELLGLNYQDLTMLELNDGQLTPELQVKKVEEKFDSYLKDQKAKADAQAETDKQTALKQEQQVISDFQREIHSFITENAKKYELTQFEGQYQLVYDVIDGHYNRTIDPNTGLGKIMSLNEAADKVELYLKGKYAKAKELESVKSLWAQTPNQPAKPKHVPIPKPTRTLNNNMSATPQRPRTSVLTDEERIQKAIAYARGLRP